MYFSLMAILFTMGCSKSDDSTINQDENQVKSARAATAFGMPGDDNPGVLKTSLWKPPSVYTAPEGYPAYVASNYDLMAHFVYISPVAISGVVIEWTFPHIEYFVSHITNKSEYRTYTVNNVDNITVITCTTDLVAGPNPMFCFLVKIDCGKGNSGFTTFWTDMKVNGVSVKGTIKNKVFACN